MLIRGTLAAVTLATAAATLAACSPVPDPIPDGWLDRTNQTEQTEQNRYVCDVVKYKCYPYDANSQVICNIACGNPYYCADYTTQEYRYCLRYPGTCMSGFRCCDTLGNPTWPTACMAGYQP
jgi:hypothetical protein